MSDMEYVEKVIDRMIADAEEMKMNPSMDALDKSYCDCSIGTLRLLKSRLGILKYNV